MRIARGEPHAARRAEALSIVHAAQARTEDTETAVRLSKALLIAATYDDIPNASFYVDGLIEIGRELVRRGAHSQAEQVFNQALVAAQVYAEELKGTTIRDDLKKIVIARGALPSDVAVAWAKQRQGLVKAYALLGAARSISEPMSKTR
jgi:hypothetical protein